MPGNVANAVSAGVLPQTLCTAFQRAESYPLQSNLYRNGESQRALEGTTPRRRWRITRRLVPDDLATLRSFFEARKGPHQAFYFYDPWDTSPKFSYDPSGVDPIGRYLVRFAGGWSDSVSAALSEVSFELIEVA